MSIGHFLIIYSKLGIQVFWSTQRNSIIEQYKWTNFSDNGEVYTLHSRQYWFLKNSSPCKRHSSDPLVNYFLKKSVGKKNYFNIKWSLYRCVTISLFRPLRNAPRNLFETCCIAFWLEATARLKCEICYNWSIHDELIFYDSLFGSFLVGPQQYFWPSFLKAHFIIQKKFL